MYACTKYCDQIGPEKKHENMLLSSIITIISHLFFFIESANKSNFPNYKGTCLIKQICIN